MIIGITGTNGAGKGTVVDYLVTKHGFSHFSARGLIHDEVRSRGLPDNRDSLNLVGNDFRKMHGPAYVMEKLLQQAQEIGGNAVLESVRTTGEAEFLKGHGAKLCAVDADKKIRYERVLMRGQGTDKVSFEDFCAQEDREMNSPEPWNMNIFGVMKMADFTLQNNGTVEELHTQIDELSIFK